MNRNVRKRLMRFYGETGLNQSEAPEPESKTDWKVMVIIPSTAVRSDA